MNSIKTLLGSTALISAAAFSTNSYSNNEKASIFVTTGQYFYDSETNLDDGTPFTLGLGYDFGKHWGAEISYTDIGTEIENTGVNTDIQHLLLDGLYYFGGENFKPYLVLGVGDREVDVEGLASDSNTFTNLGIGFKNKFSDNFQFRGDVRAYHDLEDSFTDFGVNIGLAYLFGGKSSPKKVVQQVLDADNDGVIDEMDSCSNTPANVQVDAKGCPLDSDKDGVYDFKDKCADTSTQYLVDEDGCPKTLTEDVSIKLNINFDNNSDVVKPEYFSEIESVAKFMNQYANTSVTIAGYTDDRGAAEYNKKLSQRRADAVKAVLITNYNIDIARVTSIGFGESNPIASNDSADGRAQNRRVVANISSQVEKIIEK